MGILSIFLEQRLESCKFGWNTILGLPNTSEPNGFLLTHFASSLQNFRWQTMCRQNLLQWTPLNWHLLRQTMVSEDNMIDQATKFEVWFLSDFSLATSENAWMEIRLDTYTWKFAEKSQRISQKFIKNFYMNLVNNISQSFSTSFEFF